MSGDNKLCPYCAEEIKAAAIVCKHCGKELLIKRLDSPKKSRRPISVIGLLILVSAVIKFSNAYEKINARAQLTEMAIQTRTQWAENSKKTKSISTATKENNYQIQVVGACVHSDKVDRKLLGKYVCVYGTIGSIEELDDTFVIRFRFTGHGIFILQSDQWKWWDLREGDCIEVTGYLKASVPFLFNYINPGKYDISYSNKCR